MKRRLAWLATILTVAAGCNKASGSTRRAQTIAPGDELNLSTHPVILFEVFGEANDPRMIPIATIKDGELRGIVLTPEHWRRFDASYLHPGTSYPLYADGRVSGTATIKRGMWAGSDDPLYSLPGCQNLTPLAAVRLGGPSAQGAFTVEYLASSDTLGHQRTGQTLSRSEIEHTARTIAAQVAENAGIKPQVLDSLDFHAVAFLSGTSQWPTIVASFIDPEAENPSSTQETTTHLLVIADRDTGSAYHETYIHRIQGPLATATFRRFFDHLDVTGSGTDDIVLEGWPFGGDTYLSVMGWKNGKWEQVYRTRTKWCLDGQT